MTALSPTVAKPTIWNLNPKPGISFIERWVPHNSEEWVLHRLRTWGWVRLGDLEKAAGYSREELLKGYGKFRRYNRGWRHPVLLVFETEHGGGMRHVRRA